MKRSADWIIGALRVTKVTGAREKQAVLDLEASRSRNVRENGGLQGA